MIELRMGEILLKNKNYYLKSIVDEPEEIKKAKMMKVRNIDIKEMESLYGDNYQILFNQSIDSSDLLWAFYIDNKIELVFGLAFRDKFNIPWMVSTDKVQKMFPYLFTRYSKKILEIFKEYGKPLFNVIMVDNEIAIRWLKWLGFKFAPVHKIFEKNGIKFISFKYELDKK